MKFLPLFRVHLTHSYYTDGRCTDFDIEPTLHTQRLLTNTRCVLQAMPDGIRVLTAVTDQGVPLPPAAARRDVGFPLAAPEPGLYPLYGPDGETTNSPPVHKRRPDCGR